MACRLDSNGKGEPGTSVKRPNLPNTEIRMARRRVRSFRSHFDRPARPGWPRTRSLPPDHRIATVYGRVALQFGRVPAAEASRRD